MDDKEYYYFTLQGSLNFSIVSLFNMIVGQLLIASRSHIGMITTQIFSWLYCHCRKGTANKTQNTMITSTGFIHTGRTGYLGNHWFHFAYLAFHEYMRKAFTTKPKIVEAKRYKHTWLILKRETKIIGFIAMGHQLHLVEIHSRNVNIDLHQ